MGRCGRNRPRFTALTLARRTVKAPCLWVTIRHISTQVSQAETLCFEMFGAEGRHNPAKPQQTPSAVLQVTAGVWRGVADGPPPDPRPTSYAS